MKAAWQRGCNQHRDEVDSARGQKVMPISKGEKPGTLLEGEAQPPAGSRCTRLFGPGCTCLDVVARLRPSCCLMAPWGSLPEVRVDPFPLGSFCSDLGGPDAAAGGRRASADLARESPLCLPTAAAAAGAAAAQLEL